MTDPSDSDYPLLAEPVMPERKGQALIAWIIIIALVVAIAWLQSVRPPKDGKDSGWRTAAVLMQFQARYMVGAADFTPDAGAMYEAAKALDMGPVELRCRFLVVAGELAGPTEALEQLGQLTNKIKEHHITLEPDQRSILELLDQVYNDYAEGHLDAPSLKPEQRERLHRELGWFGDLALAPRGGPDTDAREAALRPARRTVILAVVGLGAIGLLGFLGFVALIIFLIFLFTGRLSSGIQCGSSHGGVYAETFALWMVLYISISLGLSLLPHSDWKLLFAGLGSIASLAVLFWPVVRGIPMRQVCWEIGLRGGRNPLLEPLIGLANYAMAIPLVALGLIATLVLMAAKAGLAGENPHDTFDVSNLPSHPIVQDVASGGWLIRAQLLLVASVIAPIVEEIMFRGVLYRHLREASCRLGYFVSVLISTIVTSFVFAAIHPQGLVAVPALMSVAFALTLVREWRGTLIPGMITHGIHNGVLLVFTMLTMG